MKQINLCALREIPRLGIENNIPDRKFVDGIVARKMSKFVVLRSEAVGSNLSGAIMTDRDFFYGFNIQPNVKYNNLEFIKDALMSSYEKMSELSSNIYGFIMGGWKSMKDNIMSICSHDMYNAVAETFDKIGIPFAMLCGKDAGNIADCLRIRSNRITLWGENLEKSVTEENSEKIIDILKNIYEDVEIPDDFSIKIYNKLPEFSQYYL